MNEHRRPILEMLSKGQLTLEEADRLLAALEKPLLPSSASNPDSPPKPKLKYLRILVEAEDDHRGDVPHTVNVRVPMQLLRAGVRLTNFIPKQARDHVNAAMREQGVPFDLSQIKPETLEEFICQLDDFSVDVEKKSENVKVRIFCE